MKILIITVAGMARRFSESVGKDTLKCLYYQNSPKEALLFRNIYQNTDFDKYIIVGGFLFGKLEAFVRQNFADMEDKIVLIKNEHFEDYGSGYSLYLGMKKAGEFPFSSLVFCEGDLWVDKETFRQVCEAESDVVTSNREIICAEHAVAFYFDVKGKIHYIYDTKHRALSIKEPFTAIFNSGQIWKFTRRKILTDILENLSQEEMQGTNLIIIQKYFTAFAGNEYKHFQFKKWVNCNTLADFISASNGSGGCEASL